MTTTADLIKQLILQQTNRIKTLDIGVISKVTDYKTVNVKLKHLVEGQVVEYVDVAVLPAGSGAAQIFSYPKLGETVLVGYLKHEPAPQLEHTGEIVEINELSKYIKPIVISAFPANDELPTETPAEGETIILHRSGSFIKMTTGGAIEMSATTATLNGAKIATEDE